MMKLKYGLQIKKRRPLEMEDKINLNMVIKDYVFKNMISSYKNEIFN